MSRDDDALTWEGDDDPTLEVGARKEIDARESAPQRSRELPDGFAAVGKGSDGDGRVVDPAAEGTDEDADRPGEVAPLGNAALIALGIFGGVYLLYTVGWVIGGLRLQAIAPALNLIPAAYVPAFWLAVTAPALWFAATTWLTRARPAWLRFVWLAAGAVLLIPWPFIMIGALGQ